MVEKTTPQGRFIRSVKAHPESGARWLVERFADGRETSLDKNAAELMQEMDRVRERPTIRPYVVLDQRRGRRRHGSGRS